MSDEHAHAEDEGLAAEAAEAAQAAEEAFEAEVVYEEELGELDAEGAAAEAAEAALAKARQDGLEARAAWSLVHKEHLAMLLANCFFFAGALAAWSRGVPGEPADPARNIHGLDTIRGGAIFALAIYGFWTVFLNLRYRQLVVWPFLLNALIALWVGIPGFTNGIGSDAWDRANKYVEGLDSKSLLTKVTTPLSVVPPGAWLLTAGGLLVLIVLVKGILGGASASRGASAPAGAGGRRRRR